MAKLDATAPYNWAQALANAADETVKSPMWNFPPEAREALMHERRVRFPGLFETDEIDPEYS